MISRWIKEHCCQGNSRQQERSIIDSQAELDESTVTHSLGTKPIGQVYELSALAERSHTAKHTRHVKKLAG